MVKHNIKNAHADLKKETPEHTQAGHDENCRCKETSTMSPGELLRLMMNDLAFWKNKKKS